MNPLLKKQIILSAVIVSLLMTSVAIVRLIGSSSPHETKPADMLAMLGSANNERQDKGLAVVQYVKHSGPELGAILNALTDITLAPERKKPGSLSTQSQAATRLAAILWREEVRRKINPPLDPDKLKALLARFIATDTPAEMIKPLSQISGFTSRWQSEPKEQIDSIFKLLEIAQQKRQSELPEYLLSALEGYARHHDLPEYGMEFLLERFNNPYQSRNKIVIVEIFKTVTARRSLLPAVRQAVVQAIFDHEIIEVRREAVGVLKAEGHRTGAIPDELYTADKTVNDKAVRVDITSAILQLKTGPDPEFKHWLAISNDKTASGDVRKSAINIITHNYKTNPEVPKNVETWLTDDDAIVRAQAIWTLQSLVQGNHFKGSDKKLIPLLNAGIKDPDANVRGMSISAAFGLLLSDDEKFRFAELGMQDEVTVRKMLAMSLQSKALPHDKSIPFFIRLLQDDDTGVVIKAMDSIARAGINTDSIRSQVKRLTTAEDKTLQRRAKRALSYMEQNARNPLEVVTDVITEPRAWLGAGIFMLLAVTGIIIAAGFGLFFIRLIIACINTGSTRSLAATVVLMVWTGLALTMVGVFFAGAFSFGHTSTVPLSSQLQIDFFMALSLAVFAGLGWFLKRLINVQEKNRSV